MTWRCRAVWVAMPTEAHIRAWTPELEPTDAHPAAEGITR